MNRYVLINTVLGEISVIAALNPALAAEAVDVSFGDKDGWRYDEQPAGGCLAEDGYEVYEAAGYAGENADTVRAKFFKVANIAKVMDRAERLVAVRRAAETFRSSQLSEEEREAICLKIEGAIGSVLDFISSPSAQSLTETSFRDAPAR